MKALRSLLLLLLLAAPAAAQNPEPDALAVVRRLFDAMRMQDTAALRATFGPGARLIGAGVNPQGQPVARAVPIDAWLRGIAGARAPTDERIFDPELRVDQNLATVWTRYEFYAGDNFSHCGYDAFQLVNSAGQWKIVQVADTQRRGAEPCGRGTAPVNEARPTASDTAAVVTALQRVFDGMRTRDTLALKDAFITEGVVLGPGPEGSRATPVGAWTQELGRVQAAGEFRERMQKPEVRISDNLATIWTWYDFHIGEQFSHCGIDAAQLVRIGTGWKVAQLSYNVRRAPCQPPTRN